MISRQFLKLGLATLGFLLTFTIVSWPEVQAYRHTEGDLVWTPFQSGNYRIGDSYYYWPITWEVIGGHWLVHSPAVLEKAGQFGVQILNSAAGWVEAWPSIFFDDPRWIYFFGLYGCFAAYFIFAFYAADFFISHLWGSVIVACLFTWFADFFQAARNYGYFFDLDTLTGRLRYLNTNATALLTLSFLGCLVVSHTKKTWSWSLAAALLGVALAFNYPPQAIVSYQILAFAFGLSLLQRDGVAGVHLIAIGLGIISTLMVVRYPSIYSTANANSPFVGLVFKNTLTFSVANWWRYWMENRSLSDALTLGAVTWPLMFFLTRRSARLRFWVLTAGACFLLNFGLSTVNQNPLLVDRLFLRGVFTFWPLLFYICCAQFLVKIWPVRWGHTVGALTLVFLLLTPVRGFDRFEHRLREKNYRNRQFTQAQWELYSWMRQHISSDESVLAIDWNDIFNIPMTTHAKLYFGHWLLNNRSWEEEWTKFHLAQHVVGRSTEEVQNSLARSCRDAADWLAAGERGWANSKIPIVEDSLFQNAMIPFGIFYWPYIKELNHFTICQGDSLGSDFRKLIERTPSSEEISASLREASVYWILVHPETQVSLPAEITTQTEFANSYGRLIRLSF